LYSDDANNNTTTIPILENNTIFEKNVSETLLLADMNIRIALFTEYLLRREEKCIVIVGHSAFFRRFLNTPTRLSNCEVGVVAFDEDGKCCGDLEILVPGGQALLASDEEEGGAGSGAGADAGKSL
jgi:hypothetical protein